MVPHPSPTATAVELTLIVAATRSMGIGANGGLPWKGLRREMAYFSRVTKRLPSQAPPHAVNAVIMGRKTWDSIPPRFRPLADRLNVVVASHPLSLSSSASSPTTTTTTTTESSSTATPIAASSLADALAQLQIRGDAIARIFVIGGARVYGAALDLDDNNDSDNANGETLLSEQTGVATRVLLTRIEGDFDCDTFFPITLDDGRENQGWARASKDELDAWAGETVPEGTQVEAGVEYEFQMWERRQ